MAFEGREVKELEIQKNLPFAILRRKQRIREGQAGEAGSENQCEREGHIEAKNIPVDKIYIDIKVGVNLHLIHFREEFSSYDEWNSS